MGGGARCPTPPSESARREKSLWAEEALSKQRNAAWCPRDGGGEESGGGAAEAARLPASLLANPGKLPPPPAGAVAAPGKREEAALSGCFPVHFCRPGWRERESSCSAAPRGCRARTPEPYVRSVPVAGLGTEPAKVSENAQSAGSLPRSWATRVPRGPWPPSPRALSAQRERKTARGGAGELEPVLVVPAPAEPRPCFRPGMLPQWVAGTPGQWI